MEKLAHNSSRSETGTMTDFVTGHLRVKTITKRILYKIWKKSSSILRMVSSQLVNWQDKRTNWFCNSGFSRKMLSWMNQSEAGSGRANLQEAQDIMGPSIYGPVTQSPGFCWDCFFLCKERRTYGLKDMVPTITINTRADNSIDHLQSQQCAVQYWFIASKCR